MGGEMKVLSMRALWLRARWLPVLLVLLPGLAAAAEWVERPFDPAIGSRWIVVTEMTSEESHQNASQTMTIKATYETTWTAKTDNGFRVSVVAREMSVTGDTPSAALMGSIVGAVKDVVVRGVTDRSGRPVQVENLDEVKQITTSVVEKFTAQLQPQVVEVVNSLLKPMMSLEGRQAAEMYLEGLTILSVGQNTGLKSDEQRSQSLDVPNPLGGGPLKANSTMAVLKADPATGDVTYLQTQVFDPNSVRALAENIARQIIQAAGKNAGAADASAANEMMTQIMKQTTISMDVRNEFDVVGGMTRAVRQQATNQVNMIGVSRLARQSRTMSVSPAP